MKLLKVFHMRLSGTKLLTNFKEILYMIIFSLFYLFEKVKVGKLTGLMVLSLAISIVFAENLPKYPEIEAEQLGPFDPPTWAVPYEHASAKRSVCLQGAKLKWRPKVEKSGTYYLWVRCRSGWHVDKFLATKPGNVQLKIGDRKIEMVALRETLEYHGDGENFVWFRSEPLNLDVGTLDVNLSSAWEYLHVDKLSLAPEGSFRPAIGNVEIMMQSAGKLSVWKASSPYLMPKQIDAAIPEKDGSLVFEVSRGGTAYQAILLRNAPDARNTVELIVSFHAEPGSPLLQSESIKIFRLARTGMRIGSSLAMDALPEINSLGDMSIAPGRTEMLWLMAKISPDMPAGEYKATIQFENQASLKMTAIPVIVRVNDVMLPASPDIATFNWWGYYDSWWGGPKKTKPCWDDQVAHGTNSFRVVPYREVKFQFDSAGKLVGAMDFSRLAMHVKYLKKTGGYILLDWDQGEKDVDGLQCKFPGAAPGANLAFMSIPWQRAYKTLVLGVTEYFASQGIQRDHILQYPFDEYMGENFVRVGRLLRQWDARLKIFADLSAPIEVYRTVAPYVDVWCPIRRDLPAMAKDGRLDFMKKNGKVWSYEASYIQRGFSPYEYFRLPFWETYHYGLDGCTFWKYMGDKVGAVYYPWNVIYGNPPVTSRRWEAWWSGAQDYMLLKKLEKVAKSKSPQAADADRLIKTATEDVLGHRDDATLAEKYRLEIIKLLEMQKTENE